MTQYAYYDHTVAAPSPVIGWYDDALISYPDMPAEADLLALTADQWAARMTGQWAVTDGGLVVYTPALTPPRQAAVDLAAKLAAGITITSTGTPAVDGVYALDSVSTGQIFQIGLYANQFAVFPSGGTTQAYPDIAGTPHSFPVTTFVAFLRAVAPLVSALQTQAGIEAQGGTPSWPAQTATIL